MRSLLERLIYDLEEIEKGILRLIDASKILPLKEYEDLVMIRPEYHWDELDNEGLTRQTNVLVKYRFWCEIIEFLFRNKPDGIRDKVQDLNIFVTKWIQRTEDDWSVPSSIEEAKGETRTRLNEFREYINWLGSIGGEDLILIPDTNSLIDNPNIQDYGTALGEKRYHVIFVPMVLSELDDLKHKEKDPETKKNVKSVISRYKGYRRQGSLHEGITIYKNITVKSIPFEPKMEETLRWLDKDCPDDRIIASALEIQRRNSAAKVVLVTSDINLQNKAEAARLPHIETP